MLIIGTNKIHTTMNRWDLDELMQYALKNKMMDKPFQEVLADFNKEMEETYEDALADMYNSSVEAHDEDFYSQAV